MEWLEGYHICNSGKIRRGYRDYFCRTFWVMVYVICSSVHCFSLCSEKLSARRVVVSIHLPVLGMLILRNIHFCDSVTNKRNTFTFKS